MSIEVILPRPVEPSGLEVRAQTETAPAPGHVTLRMEATGVSFAEQQMRRGRYYDQPKFPFVPGYDVVGTVSAVGADVDPAVVGRRFAAVTKTGAWATFVDVAAIDLLPAPADLDPAVIESVVVNGITAWQMLDVTGAKPGATIVVLGANGGVGSILVRLARHRGMRVIGTASRRHHDALRALGVEPVDYHDADASAQLHRLAADGADAVFDHVGGPGLTESWRLVRRGGTLMAYGSATTMDAVGNPRLPMLKIIGRLALWNALPNGKRARLYDFWAGRSRRHRYIQRQRDAFDAVVALVRSGAIRPGVAKRFPLAQASTALHVAETQSHAGKIVLVGDK